MSTNAYPLESLDSDSDDGTMPDNVAKLAESVVGHKIVSVERNVSIPGDYEWQRGRTGTALSLDNGKQVIIENTDDCCAYTDLEEVILHLDKIEHVITGVGTTDGYETWHIYADLGDVMELKVGWSSGNPFYYGYGFNISVRDIPEVPKVDRRTATRLDIPLPDFNGDAAIYRLEPPMDGNAFVVVSAITNMWGTETYIFASDQDGKVSEWHELKGSYKGGMDHAEALRGAGYTVSA